MDKQTFWKNFKLGQELHISGRFIFNGLRCFHEMEHLYHYDEIFETLYNLSAGTERLLKVAIILTEHDSTVEQSEFESSLITHDHQSLLLRLKESRQIGFSTVHNDLLAILGAFYKTHRYDRYVLATMTTESKEKSAIHEFFEKHLKIEIKDEAPFNVSENTDQLRRFIGRTVGKITKALYDLICNEATRHNIYTYEIRNDSKASKIFIHEKYDFLDEDVLWREILVFLMNGDEQNGVQKFFKTIPPLEFDPGLIQEYLDCFKSSEKMLVCLGELKELYSGLSSVKDRLETISLIANADVVFDDDNDGQEDWA